MKGKEIFELEELALEGNQEAVRELVRRYTEGDGIPVDTNAAEIWKEYLVEEPTPEPEVMEMPNQTEEIKEEVAVKDESNEQNNYDSWSDLENEYNEKNLFTLRELSDAGDAYAKLFIGEKYLQATTANEQAEGAQLMNDALASIRDSLMENEQNNDFNVEALKATYHRLGNHYIDSGNPKNAFDCFSNIYELTGEIPDELIDCYKNGLGTEQNKSKADELCMKKASSGGIADKVLYAESCVESGARLKAAEWYEAARRSSDAEQHPALICYSWIRYLKECKDPENVEIKNAITQREEELQHLYNSGDEEAISCMRQLGEETQQEKGNEETIGNNPNLLKGLFSKTPKTDETKENIVKDTEGKTDDLNTKSFVSNYNLATLIKIDALILPLSIIMTTLLANAVWVVLGIFIMIFLNGALVYLGKRGKKVDIPTKKFAIIGAIVFVVATIGSYFLAPANAAMSAIEKGEPNTAKRIIGDDIEGWSLQESMLEGKIESYVEETKDKYSKGEIDDSKCKTELKPIIDVVGDEEFGQNIKAYYDSIDNHKSGMKSFNDKKYIEAINALSKVSEDFPKYKEAQKTINESKKAYKKDLFDKVGTPKNLGEYVSAAKLLKDAQAVMKDDEEINQKREENETGYITELETAVDKWIAAYEWEKADKEVEKAKELIENEDSLSKISKKVMDSMPTKLTAFQISDQNNCYGNNIEGVDGSIDGDTTGTYGAYDLDKTVELKVRGFSEEDGYVIFNIGKGYKRLRGVLAMDKETGSDFSGKVGIYNNRGKAIWGPKNVKKMTRPMKVDIPIADTDIVKFKFEAASNCPDFTNGWLMIAEFMVYK